MKIVFISNFMNHHQLPVAKNLYQALGEDYKFVALEPLPQERRDMGYEDMNDSYPFVLPAYASEENMELANNITLKCDILLAGSCPDFYIKRRTDIGKPVIKTSERYFKQAVSLKDQVRNFLSAKKHLSVFQDKPLYFLCASAYTSADINKYTKYPNRAYKWGYFTEVKKYPDIESIIKLKHDASILWVARLIEWKHPEIPVIIAKRLKNEGIKFRMELIGNGRLQQDIQQMIKDNNLEDCVNLLGAMSPERVRMHMENSQIFMFTSDRNEGWGAVINEAMNSGCAVVANRAIGSVPFLIEEGKNGLAYKDGDIEELYEKTKLLLANHSFRNEMAKNAYQTMIDEWNPENASRKLLVLIDELLSGKKNCNPFSEGVCSYADII